MLRLTILDNVSSLRWKHSNDAELKSLNVEPFITLDSALVIVPPAPAELFVVHRQKLAADRFLTWIGLYRAVPVSVSNRRGDYCGAGMWLLNAKISGADAAAYLRELISGVFKSMPRGARPAWDINRAPLDAIAQSIEEPPQRQSSGRGEVGRDTVCIDAAGGDLRVLEDALDEAQEESGGALERFCRILVAPDSATLEAVQARGRIAVKTLSALSCAVAPARAGPPNDDRDRLVRGAAATRPDFATPTQPTNSGAAREVAKLSLDVRQLQVRMDELSRAVQSVGSGGTRKGGMSWIAPALLIAGVALGVVLAVFLGDQVTDVFGTKTDAADQQAKLQKQIDELRADVRKTADAVIQLRVDRSAPLPQAAKVSPPEVVDPAVAAAPSKPSAPTPATVPSPPLRPQTPTISSEGLHKLQGIALASGEGAAPGVIIVDVDGVAKDHVLIPGAQLCLATLKPIRGARCTAKDLLAMKPEGFVLVFYGHENGPRSAAADLAADLAGTPNVFLYRATSGE